MQKARSHPLLTFDEPLTKFRKRNNADNSKQVIGLLPLVGERFQVLFHSPNRGTFHLSVTLLVHYRSLSST